MRGCEAGWDGEGEPEMSKTGITIGGRGHGRGGVAEGQAELVQAPSPDRSFSQEPEAGMPSPGRDQAWALRRSTAGFPSLPAVFSGLFPKGCRRAR